MNKRKNTSHVTITLFPFLSVIACVIGTLTLLLAGLAVGAITTGDSGNGDSGNGEYDRTLQSWEVAQAEISKLEKLIADAGAAKDLLTALQNRMEALGIGSMDVDAALALLEQVAKLREEIGRTEKEVALTKRKKSQASVAVIPMGGGQGLIPAFVECTEAGLVLEADAPEDRQRSIPRSSIEGSKELVEYFQKVGAKPNWTVIFLIRRGGVKSYDLANRVINDQKIRNGCLAAPGTMKLNFDAYRRLKGDETGGRR